MDHAQSGDKVTVAFTGKFSNDEIFDCNNDEKPLIFTIGTGKVIKGFEESIIGMKIGEKKSICVPYKDAYGPIIEQLIFDIDRNLFPESIDPKVNLELKFKQDNGKVLFAKIIDVQEKSVTVNANHPLAGKDLLFEIKLIDIIKKDNQYLS